MRGANSVAVGADPSRAFDREIKRSLSKLKKKNVDSGSETSDDDDGYSEGDETESETTVSDTESDVDVHSGAWDLKGNSLKLLEPSESVTDDRILGGRMTKASLVPPVTRKYEVIEEYLIVADEEEVQRKCGLLYLMTILRSCSRRRMALKTWSFQRLRIISLEKYQEMKFLSKKYMA